MRNLILVAIATFAAALAPVPAHAAERLAFPSRSESAGPYQIELADPVGGGAQLFASSDKGPIDPTFSHDGKTIAYFEQFGRGVLMRPVAGGAETGFLGPNAARPSWSPVKAEVAYWESTQDGASFRWRLKVASTDDGTTRTVAGPFDPQVDFPLAGIEQPAWSADGKTIAFAYRRDIVSVPAVGGARTTLVTGGATGTDLVHQASYAPDGKQLAYRRSFEAQTGGFDAWHLVVRDLRDRQEVVVASGLSVSGDTSDGAIGPQAWSPDSARLAFSEQHTLGTRTPLTYEGTLNVVGSDGNGRRTVLRRTNVGAPAWGGGGPSYYIKHVEVTQAISPGLDPLPDRDPLAPDPYTIQRSQPSVSGFALPLVAEKSTLLRIYIGDASLPQGATDLRSLQVSVIDEGTGIDYGPPTAREVDVTARNEAPAHSTEHAAVNVWVAPEAARGGASNSFNVHVNPDQKEQECQGCYPNGNVARVQDIRYDEGGRIVIAPVPIRVIAPNSTVHEPSFDALEGALEGAVPMLPVRDDAVTISRSPGQVFAAQEELTPQGGCSVLVERLLSLRATPGIAGPVEGAGATRWVGYAPRVFTGAACVGKADNTPGRNFVLLGPNRQLLAHELGHTLGLPHATGQDPTNVPPGSIPLPYSGIGGVGTQAGVGGVTEIFTSATTSDIMSYDLNRWISPVTWALLHQKILAESGAIQPRITARRARVAASKPGGKRLVSGILQGTETTMRSLVTERAAITSSGPTAATVVARDARGKTVARADIHGTPEQEEGETKATLPFVVALPDKQSIASLQIVPAGQGKPLATVRASKHAPKGRFLKLPRKARSKSALTIRWSASDRDRRDKLTVQLLARRGSSPWRSIALAPAKGRMAVDPSTLGTGKALRLRLRVSDGFRTTVVNARKITLR